jgi:imidazolonepropionase-like amidohydrolase
VTGECGAWVVTTYPDGTQVHAHPNHDADSYATAWELGHESVQDMTYWHDQIHSLIAWAVLGTNSPVLWSVAHQEEIDPEMLALEEAAVLALQKWRNRWLELNV